MNVLGIPRYHLTSGEQDILDEMLGLATASYQKRLQGDWTLEVMRGEHGGEFVIAHNLMWQEIFANCYHHWQAGDNVLMVDTDTICCKPVEFFGKYEQMFMPWNTCRTSGHPQYRNAGVIYFPNEMRQEIWDIGLAKMPTITDSAFWGPELWDSSQLVMNDMFWAQSTRPEADPALNWSPHVPNPLEKWQASIIHCHGSRDRMGALGLMRSLA